MEAQSQKEKVFHEKGNAKAEDIAPERGYGSGTECRAEGVNRTHPSNLKRSVEREAK